MASTVFGVGQEDVDVQNLHLYYSIYAFFLTYPLCRYPALIL